MDVIGQELGRYRLVELIGRGGMGAVYRARDTALDREVAVKVLAPTEAGGEKRLERFRREARAVAQLSHPNILAIHDFGEHDGATYAVTELLEGEDLSTRLQGSPLAVHEATRIAVAVAEGLAAAHRTGILHRDVKPHNIFLTTDGDVKILDFGLARSTGRGDRSARTETAEPDLTEEGAVLGTVAYMSPEQVRGEGVDHRSDLFSLGTVLYQMVTGAHPFRRDGRMDTMSAILRDDPLPPSTSRDGVPPTLDEIVLRCLRKAPGHRFQSADDLAFALRSSTETRTTSSDIPTGRPAFRRRAWLVAAAVALVALAGATALSLRNRTSDVVPDLPGTKRIVIARFQPATDDPELRTFAAGMTEVVASGLELIAEDTNDVAWLRPQAAEDRPLPDDLPNVAREFNTNLAVTGTLGPVRDQIHLLMHLIDPPTGSALRTVELDVGRGNPATLQLEPAQRLAGLLGLAVSDPTADRLQSRATNSTDALDGYVRGVGALALADTGSDIETAIAVLDGAVEADPLFAPARLAITDGCLRLYTMTGNPAWLERGRQEAAVAAEHSAFRSSAFLAAAAVADAAGDLETAIATSESAVAADPANPEAHARLARRLHRAGRTVEAADHLQRAMFLRPSYWPDHHWAARFHMSEGHYDAAANEWRRVIEIAPENPGGYNSLGVMYALLDERARARAAFEGSLRIAPDHNYVALTNLGTLAFQDGRYNDAADLFERALVVEDGDYQVWGNLGHTYALGAMPERAEEPTRRAIALATVELRNRPHDPQILCDLAGYYAELGETSAGLSALAAVTAQKPTDPMMVADIAHTFEDLNDRDSALTWVERAFEMGVPPDYFKAQVTLRDLVSDDRFRLLVDEFAASTNS